MESGRWTRRGFLAASALTTLAASLPIAGAAQPVEAPWHQKIRRWGQLNLNERDARGLEVDRWLDYWASLKVDGLTLNAGGIVAFYPTTIPFHHRSEFLGMRDVFGELAAGCQKRGLRLIARLDPNYAWEDCFKARPDWFRRTRDGRPITHNESTWLYNTCMFGPYYSEQIPAIIREINARYEVSGYFTNGWPGTSIAAPCFCERCRALFRQRFGMDLPADSRPSEGAYRNFVRFHEDRVLEVWKLWDAAAKEKAPENLYFGNLGGSVRATLNMGRIGALAAWYNADHQGRSGNMPLWDAAQQGRACRAAVGNRTATNITGAYANAQPLWRHTSKAAAEARLWLAQATASGTVPWLTWLGSQPGDTRWMEVGRRFFQWHAANSAHFENRRSLANVAILWSQRTNAFYRAEGPRADRSQIPDYLQGFYFALLQARIPFDLVHEDDLGAERLRQYRVLVLPNVALLSDGQCQQLSSYARSGGSLVATYETSLYNEWAEARADFGLAAVFGVKAQTGVQGPLGNSYARVEKPHEILAGLAEQGLIPGAEFRVRVDAGRPADVLSYVPPYPAFPPEMVYPRVEKTEEPAVVLREQDGGRVVYFPGDVDRTFWRSGNPDLARLLQNSLRWAMNAAPPVEILGQGLVDAFLWETTPGLALHLVNYNNPGLMKGPVTEFSPIGRQQVRLRLPEGFRVREVRLLAAGRGVPHAIDRGVLQFEIPSVTDYEVAAILRA
jgi:hypothetical protein